MTLPSTPKVAALDYSRDLSPARQAFLSQFPVAVLSLLQAQLNPTALPATLTFLQALRNAGTKIAQYVVLKEWPDPLTSTSEQYGYWQTLNAQNWWVLQQPGGAKTPSTTQAGANLINVTRETMPDGQGRHVPAAKAAWDYQTYLSSLAGHIDHLFVDNSMFQPRASADWNCDGVQETPQQGAAAFRTALADYYSALQALLPGVGIIGNSDCDTTTAGGYGCSLSKPELLLTANGGFLEAVVGKSYSLEGFAGVSAVLKYIRSAINSTKGQLALVGAYADLTSAAGIQTARYGLCISLQEDGYYTLNAATGGAPEWLDEFGQHIGDPVDGPQSGAAAGFGGLFARHYSSGLALVNPTTAAITVDLTGQGYRRFSGVQDPVTNNGQAVTTVAVPAKDGLLLLR
jgi:hypothetical protein